MAAAAGSAPMPGPQTSAMSPRWSGDCPAGSALKITGMPSVLASSRRATTFSMSSATGERPAGNAATKWFCMSWIRRAARAGSILHSAHEGGIAERSGMG